jgi:hypothetical protein
MSLSIDLYEVKKEGDSVIVEFFDDDLETKQYVDIFNYFKPFLVESMETVFNTNAALIALGVDKQVSMTDYYVSAGGWSYWVDNQRYIIPKNEIPTENLKMYTLKGTCLRGLDSTFTDKYLNEMYENEHRYIFGKQNFNHYKKFSKKNVGLNNIQWTENLLVHNSY